MRNYSDINSNTTYRDKVINDFVSESGMQKNHVISLFESYKMSGLTNEEIKQSFDKMLSDNISNVSLGIITDLENPKEFSQRVLSLIKDFNSRNPLDSVGLANLVSNTILSKDKNFENVFNKIDVLQKLPEFDSIQENPSKEDIQLFESLRDILARNKSKFGFSYHLENCYNAIWNYLDKEINDLITKDNIYSRNETFNKEVIEHLLNDTLNPMYKNIDFLKQSTTDFETLCFDIVCLIYGWSRSQDERVFTMINKQVYKDFLKATKNVLTAIWSSSEKSYLLKNHPNNAQDILEKVSISLTGDIEAFSKLQRMEIKNIIFGVELIRVISEFFNPSIRPYLRDYATKTWNLVGRAEHLIYELQRIGYYHV